MSKIKTSELKGADLDFCVAIALGRKYSAGEAWSPSTDWSEGGVIIDSLLGSVIGAPPYERRCDGVDLVRPPDAKAAAERLYAGWECRLWHEWGRYVGQGETPLIAVCRALVASKLGNEVDPDELTQAAEV